MKNVFECVGDCHIVRACKIKYTTSGVAIGNFSIAVNDSFKKDGQWVDEASFFECIAYGKTAETLKNYVVSGQRMFFVLRPKQECWIDKEGNKHSRIVFVVENFSFGEKPRGSQNVPPANNQQNYNEPQQQPFKPATAPAAQPMTDNLFDDESNRYEDFPVF